MKTSQKLPWTLLSIGATIGALASFVQLIELVAWAKEPLKSLACDLNSVFSCSSVFGSWQSSVFGFSNTIMCLLFFGVTLGVGLSGLFGGEIHRKLRLTMQFFSLFFLGFGAWYLQQSAMVIQALCIFCILCYSGVILINWSWIRLNYRDMGLASSTVKKAEKNMSHGIDTFIWLVWALLICGMFIVSFV